MRVLVCVPANKDSEAGVMPNREQLEEMGKFNEELVKAGVMLMGEGLHPTSRAKRVQFGGGKATIVDGPFAESKELIAGFWIWQVRSLDEAVAWIKKSPFMQSSEAITFRPIFDAEDFGEALTPDMRAYEERLRKLAAERQARASARE